MEVEETTTKTVDITPEAAAKAFAHMSTDEQVEFFAALADEVKATFPNLDTWPDGDLQWCMMASDLKENPKANRMYMALSVYAFDFWDQRYFY